MSQTILPAEAHVVAGQLEDNLTVWRSRTPGVFHPSTRAACVESQLLCGEMILVFGRLRDELVAEMAAYDDERVKGMR